MEQSIQHSFDKKTESNPPSTLNSSKETVRKDGSFNPRASETLKLSGDNRGTVAQDTRFLSSSKTNNPATGGQLFDVTSETAKVALFSLKNEEPKFSPQGQNPSLFDSPAAFKHPPADNFNPNQPVMDSPLPDCSIAEPAVAAEEQLNFTKKSEPIKEPPNPFLNLAAKPMHFDPMRDSFSANPLAAKSQSPMEEQAKKEPSPAENIDKNVTVPANQNSSVNPFFSVSPKEKVDLLSPRISSVKPLEPFQKSPEIQTFSTAVPLPTAQSPTFFKGEDSSQLGQRQEHEQKSERSQQRGQTPLKFSDMMAQKTGVADSREGSLQMVKPTEKPLTLALKQASNQTEASLLLPKEPINMTSHVNFQTKSCVESREGLKAMSDINASWSVRDSSASSKRRIRVSEVVDMNAFRKQLDSEGDDKKSNDFRRSMPSCQPTLHDTNFAHRSSQPNFVDKRCSFCSELNLSVEEEEKLSKKLENSAALVKGQVVQTGDSNPSRTRAPETEVDNVGKTLKQSPSNSREQSLNYSSNSVSVLEHEEDKPVAVGAKSNDFVKTLTIFEPQTAQPQAPDREPGEGKPTKVASSQHSHQEAESPSKGCEQSMEEPSLSSVAANSKLDAHSLIFESPALPLLSHALDSDQPKKVIDPPMYPIPEEDSLAYASSRKRDDLPTAHKKPTKPPITLFPAPQNPVFDKHGVSLDCIPELLASIRQSRAILKKLAGTELELHRLIEGSKQRKDTFARILRQTTIK